MEQSYEIKAYKIWYDDEPDQFYIGSTKRNLSVRMGDHRRSAKFGKAYHLYDVMRTKGVNTFKYVMLGSAIVRNKDEQMMYEQKHIDMLKPTLNSKRAWDNLNGDRSEYMKNYRSIKFPCVYCGKSYRKDTLLEHNKTKKHLQNFIHF